MVGATLPKSRTGDRMNNLAVIVRNRKTGKFIDYRAFAPAIRDTAYMRQLVNNPENDIKVVVDTFLDPPKAQRVVRSRSLYTKPKTPVAALPSAN